MCLTQTLLALGAFVADQNDFRFFVRMEIADNIRSPISIADHTNPDHRAPWDYKRHARLARASGPAVRCEGTSLYVRHSRLPAVSFLVRSTNSTKTVPNLSEHPHRSERRRVF